MNILASLTVLGFLILFHETGHFLAARLQGIRVNGFSIGFGPALIKKEIQGIDFALRALPLGGFVSFPDDDDSSGFSPNDPNLLKNRPIIQRLFVISAGVLANLLIAWIVIFSQAAFIGVPSQPEQGVLIVNVQENEAAYEAGLSAGDTVLSVNGQKLGQGQEAVQSLVNKIKNSPEIELEIERKTEI